MIPDRIIEQGTLRTDGNRVSVEIRMPWYRALPASCIAGGSLQIDGIEVPGDTLRWELNGTSFRTDQLAPLTSEWWFPVDSIVLSGDLPIAVGARDHRVDVEISLFIPYIILDGDQTLSIHEHDAKTMEAQAA